MQGKYLLIKLRKTHAEHETAIQEELRLLVPSEFRIQNLKRQKLILKDKIANLVKG